jgi:hypothetical protein
MFRQICKICIHSATYILQKFYRLMMKLSAGQVSFRERELSYFSDRKIQTDDNFLLVLCDPHNVPMTESRLARHYLGRKTRLLIACQHNYEGLLRRDAV